MTATLAPTATRVERSTADDINRAIEAATRRRLAWYADRTTEIGGRLAALDREWDVERTLEANAATLSLLGGALGATRSRMWFLLPFGVAAFLLQHAVQGWCPPLPVLRRMGFRTAREIERERTALRLLRGDFGPTAAGSGSGRARADSALMLIDRGVAIS
jgi:hypothetical protein